MYVEISISCYRMIIPLMTVKISTLHFLSMMIDIVYVDLHILKLIKDLLELHFLLMDTSVKKLHY